MSKAELAEVGLSNGTQHEWATDLENLRTTAPHRFAGTAALALYLSTRTLSNFKKAHPLLLKLQITPEMIYSFSQIVRVEEGKGVEGLLSQIFFEKEEARRKKKTQTINDSKKKITERARAIASKLWEQKADIRIGEMAEEAKKLLVDEGFTDLPETIGTIKNWIRTVAPPEAKRPGKPRKRVA